MKLRTCSLFGALAGALILTAALAPSAKATRPIVYFNFEGVVGVTPGTFNSVPAPGPGGAYPFLQSTSITQPAGNDPFPTGQFLVTAGVGTTLNQLAGDAPTTNSALDLAGNTSAMGSTAMYCFQFGANTTTANPGLFTDISLSFALNSIGNGGQFTTIALNYATVANPTLADFTNFYSASISQGIGYYLTTASLPAGAFNQADLTLQFCLGGSKNNAVGNHTFIDNIQLTATVVPEPSTYIGGLLGVLGLCLFQRRWLVRSLRFRRA